MDSEIQFPPANAKIAYDAFYSKKYQESVHLFESIIAARKATNSSEPIADYLLSNDYAVALAFSGKSKEALDILSRSLAFFETQKTMKYIGMTYGNMAVVSESLKNKKKAMEYYQEAVSILAKAQAQAEHSACLRALAVLQAKQGKLYKAVWNYIKAVDANPNPTILDRFVRLLLRFWSS